MAVPAFSDMMLPLVECLKDGHERSAGEIREQVADAMGISEADRNEMLPSRRESRFSNRISWACIYLKKARSILVAEVISTSLSAVLMC